MADLKILIEDLRSKLGTERREREEEMHKLKEEGEKLKLEVEKEKKKMHQLEEKASLLEERSNRLESELEAVREMADDTADWITAGVRCFFLPFPLLLLTGICLIISVWMTVRYFVG